MKQILDACCGSRMFWFNRNHPDAVYMDNRALDTTLCDGRKLTIAPDIVADFRAIPFADNSFRLVVFDPPHLVRAGEKSWVAQKYGVLSDTWPQDIKRGFDDCMRVLKPGGVLIFKWNEDQIKLADVYRSYAWDVFSHVHKRRGCTRVRHGICNLRNVQMGGIQQHRHRRDPAAKARVQQGQAVSARRQGDLMRLIDADALRESVLAANDITELAFDNCFPYWRFSKCIREAATIDQVRHARWECDDDEPPRCARCGNKSLLDGSENYELSTYCPSCGCKMDGAT